MRRHRIAAGLSQEALAERARVSTQGIGALERGDRRTPQRETLTLLIEALDLNAEQRVAFEAAALRQHVPRDGAPTVFGLAPAIRQATLPLSLTSFVGREVEVKEIADLAFTNRLITLTGPGGIGKTRTALDVARVLSDDARDDVRFVELAALRDPGLVVDAVVAIFNLGETPNRAPFDTLVAFLQPKRVVLVIDNCEHVIAEVAVAVEGLLRGCPQLKILATSREPLRVPGERVYRLPSLETPSLEHCGGLTAAHASTFPAIELFAQRAGAVDRTFVLDDQSAPVVAEICAHVEGIPLAIELAAARVTAISLPALAANLRRRFTLLGNGGRTVHSRQQTMRAAIDWSFDLLDESERRLFASLAVFAGGCTIDAIVDVAGDATEADGGYVRVFDVLSSLVDKSLVVADVGGYESRYGMLEPFRQYAHEKLIETGELQDVSRRHATAFAKIAQDFARAFRREPDGDAFAAARLEMDNWRAALEWCLLARNDVRMGQVLAADLRMAWNNVGIVEGRQWVRLALEAGGAETPVELAAPLERADAMYGTMLGDFEAALAAATRALEHAKTLGDPIEIARAEGEIGGALLRLGRPREAEPFLRSALASAREHGADRLAAKILYHIAEARSEIGDFAEARAACALALEIFRDQTGEPKLTSLVTRAEIEFRAGDAEAAFHFTTEALREAAGMRASERVQEYEAVSHANAAAYLISLARYHEARTYARTAVEMATRGKFLLALVWGLQHLAAVSVLRVAGDAGERRLEDVERAAGLIGFVSKRYEELGAAVEPTERQEFERIIEALNAELPAERLAWLQARGSTMNDDEAVAEAMRV